MCFFSALLLMLFSFVTAVETQAMLITYSFEGNLTTVDPALSGTIHSFDAFTGTFTYETNTVPVAPGSYNNAVKAFSFSTNSSSASCIQCGNLFIIISNGIPGRSPDYIDMGTDVSGPSIGGYVPSTFRLFLSAPSGLALDSLALGPLPPSSAFAGRAISLDFLAYQSDALVQGQLTS
jgi:hypothetical protein